jgi:hypothetical protein
MLIRTGILILIASFVLPSEFIHAATPSQATQLKELTEYIERFQMAHSPAPLTNDELRSSIESGTMWLKEAQEKNGHFKYEYHPYTNVYSDDDNIVRQTGALYALGEILRRDSRDPLDVTETAVAAIEYFEEISVTGKFNGETFRCVAYHSASSRCPLGATALALIGVLDIVEANATTRSKYRTLINDYGTFILMMQKDNGGFRNTFRTDRTTQSETESPFSNGEALLALARLNQYDPNPEVHDAITEALAHLTDIPYDTALYLWIMAALKEVDTDTQKSTVPYTRDFTLWRIEHGKYQRSSAQNFCAFTEGVVSALSVLKGNVPKTTYELIKEESDRGIRMNRSLQLTRKDTDRAFVTGGILTIPTLEKPELGIGGFLTGEGTPAQRIDYTQHCISASLQMLTDVRDAALTTSL